MMRLEAYSAGPWNRTSLHGDFPAVELRVVQHDERVLPPISS